MLCSARPAPGGALSWPQGLPQPPGPGRTVSVFPEQSWDGRRERSVRQSLTESQQRLPGRRLQEVTAPTASLPESRLPELQGLPSSLFLGTVLQLVLSSLPHLPLCICRLLVGGDLPCAVQGAESCPQTGCRPRPRRRS